MSRELDERCARALGYATLWGNGGFGETVYLHDTGARCVSRGITENCRLLGGRWERLRVNGVIDEYFVRLCPAFSSDCNAARLLEDEIERRGLRNPYVRALWILLDCGQPGSEEGGNVWGNEWALIRATPDQRARAFLEVMEVQRDA